MADASPDAPHPRRLNAEQQAMVVQLRPCALGIARSFRKRMPRFRHLDWEGTVLESLCLAALGYRSDGGASWEHFAKIRCRGACLDLLREQSPKGYRFRRGVPRLREPAILHGVEEMGDLIGSPDLPVGWEVESEDTVRALARTLSPKLEAIVLRLYLHADKVQQNEAAEHLGIGYSAASARHKWAIEALRQDQPGAG